MHHTLLDLRLAFRQIRRAPAFAFFIVATLAVAIGANTTIFSAVHALVLKPLPWPESHRFVVLTGSFLNRGDDWSVSLPNALDWRSMNRSFDDVAFHTGRSFSLTGEGTPERLQGFATSANLFGLLGIQPVLGRDFRPDENAVGSEGVVILSHALWRRRFGGSSDVIGRPVSLGGNPYTVVGVMPERFGFPTPDAEFWVPLRADSTTWGRANGGLQVIGRLRRGVSLEQAQLDMERVSADLARAYPEANEELTAHLTAAREAFHGGRPVAVIVLTLLGAVALVLLIACVNVGNLLLARATTREREVAVRTSLGAPRSRIVRQLLTESLVLAALGGVAGIALAFIGTRGLGAFMPSTGTLPRAYGIEPAVLAFTAGVTIFAGLLFGLAPALQGSRDDLTQLLGGRSGTGSRRRTRRRNLLVVAEVSLALVLVVAASLMIRSLTGLLGRDPGFDAHGLLTLRVALDSRYAEPDQVVRLQAQVIEGLRSLPGVQAAGAVNWLPLGGTNNFADLFIDANPEERVNVGAVVASPGYREAMGMRLVAGRDLDARDDADAERVIQINSEMAERYWPGQDPVGRRVRLPWDDRPWRTVVGVYGAVRYGGLDEAPRAEFLVPYGQINWVEGTAFVVRTSGDPLTRVDDVRRVIWSVDDQLPIFDLQTMERIVRDSGAVLLARLAAYALGFFGLVALLLAALGLYAVISYRVSQRTFEIGIRRALGADQQRVLRLVIGQGMLLVGAGFVLGLLGALAFARVLRSMLHGVSMIDPVAFGASAVTLVLVALLATWVPARRAATIDPLTALRME